MWAGRSPPILPGHKNRVYPARQEPPFRVRIFLGNTGEGLWTVRTMSGGCLTLHRANGAMRGLGRIINGASLYRHKIDVRYPVT